MDWGWLIIFSAAEKFFLGLLVIVIGLLIWKLAALTYNSSGDAMPDHYYSLPWLLAILAATIAVFLFPP
jgi:hypothetical protein